MVCRVCDVEMCRVCDVKWCGGRVEVDCGCEDVWDNGVYISTIKLFRLACHQG